MHDAPTPAAEPVSLAIVNARVWTGDARRPWADGVAVRGDRVAAVGSSAQIRKMSVAATRVIDANGQMLVPGVHDTLAHFVDAGFRLDATAIGTIARGTVADFTLVDRDLARVAPDAIRDAKVTMTVVAGRVVVER